MAKLSIRLLGPFEVKLDEVVITSFESNKVRALLAYLAAEAPRPQPRERLAGLLWPGWPQTSAVSNLRKSLANLRKNMNDHDPDLPSVLSTREAIQFNFESDHWVDIGRFEELLSLNREIESINHHSKTSDRRDLSMMDGLAQAAALYRGDFLEGFSLSDSSEYETWLLAKRSYYRQKYLQLLYRLVDACDQAGRIDLGLRYAQRQLEIEPWQEEAHRQLMRLLALDGQRTAALTQFETCRQQLERELGVYPAVETIQLLERIQKDEIRKLPLPGEGKRSIPTIFDEPEVKHNLPCQLTSFIGRQREITQVKDLLARHRLVTITGPGGVGKTRLAIRVAEEVVGVYSHGVCYVELAPVTNPELVEQTVATALGLRIDQASSIVELLLRFLKTKHVLLLLDNCEHLVEYCAQLADRLLHGCPHLTILVSSREALGVLGETAYRVPSLSLPDFQIQGDRNSISNNEAVALFLDRARSVMPGFEITDNNSSSVLQICQRLDGIPLAIELAAARLDMLTTEQVTKRLANAFGLLTGGARTALPRQQTLRATIDWSYQMLSEQERRLLQHLSIFAGGCTLEGAEAVCCGEGLENEDLLELLTSLVDKSMVHVERVQGEETRYKLLETVRQYAREKSYDMGEIHTLRDRHLAYSVQLAEAGFKGLMTAERLVWTKRLTSELDNLRAAVDWAYGGGEDFESGLRIAAALGFRLMASQGYAREVSVWLRTGLDAANWTTFPDLLHVRALLALEWSNYILNTVTEEGESLLLKAINLCREIGPAANPERVYALGGLSNYIYVPGEVAALWEETLEIGPTLDREFLWMFTNTLQWKGIKEIYFHDFEAAKETALLALRFYGSEGCTDHWSSATAYQILAACEVSNGNYSEGQRHDEKALALYWESGDKIGFAGASCSQAMHLIQQKEFERAVNPNDQALRNWYLGGREKFVLAHIAFLGIILANIGHKLDNDAAKTLFHQAAVLFSIADTLYPPDEELLRLYADNKRSEAEQILRSSLSPDGYTAALAEGQSMTLEQEVELATKIAAAMSP